MKIKLLEEPLLNFGLGEFVCPKAGILKFQPYDFDMVRPEKIIIGIIGTSESIDAIVSWIEKCKRSTSSGKSKLKNLFLDFPGFREDVGFHSIVVYDDTYLRKINNSEIERTIRESEDIGNLVERVVGLYINEIRFLAKNKKPDVILCILDSKLTAIFLSENKEAVAREDEDDGVETEREESVYENNFRRLLKAKSMSFGIPLQLARDKITNPNSTMQDKATIAWNFFTALYYKASGTPWAMRKNEGSINCYAGISFYRSRDKKTTQTSVTQIFNEHGKGVILRGGQVERNKWNLEPHLSSEQAFELMDKALNEYYEALKIYPQRLVIHKSSNYNANEIEGFTEAANNNNINAVDLVTIMPTPLKLFREGDYPPFRGTFAQFDDKNYVLYTRGVVRYFETYPGKYIPNPIQIRLFQHDESPDRIANEILSLTKMNWNNTQFDRKFPITLECSRKVGEIMKYLDESQDPQIRYSFYM